LSLRDRLD